MRWARLIINQSLKESLLTSTFAMSKIDLFETLTPLCRLSFLRPICTANSYKKVGRLTVTPHHDL